MSRSLTNDQLRESPVPVSVTGGGDATAANQTAGNTLLGAVNETAPASDTASSGINGRLQRLAQRLTSLIALLPSSIGTKTAAGSVSVVQASDDPVTVATGTNADAAWSGSGNGTLVSVLKAIFGRLKPVGSTSVARVYSASSNNATSVKASAGYLYGLHIGGSYRGSACSIKFFNKASAPSPASDTPVFTFPIIAGGAPFQMTFDPPVYFSTGLAYCIVSGQLDGDNTAINLGEIHGAIHYS